MRGSGGGVEFVSTNDLVFSGFAKAVDARVAFMPIGWRGKLSLCADTDAGNYEGCLVFTPPDYESAVDVRKTLNSGPGTGTGPTFVRGGGGDGAKPPGALPGTTTTMCCRLAMVTSWAFAWFDEVALEGCEHVLHVPHCDTAMVPFEFAVLYAPRKGQRALATMTRACGSERLAAELPLGAVVA